ncbi:MAG: hypothetical protein J6K92_06430 [Oscillospiraceae bacterium]|nr:hypothetical protein [Oscillospiraceae bacterium]
MAESIIEGLWEYLKGCPLLAEFTVGVNFRKDDIDSAGIVEDNTEPIRKYVSGSELKALHILQLSPSVRLDRRGYFLLCKGII